MYHKSLNIIVLLGMSLAAGAQSKDSTKTITFLSDSVSRNMYDLATENGFLLRSEVQPDVNTLELGYKYDNGNFIKAQDSKKTNGQYLHTEGKRTLGRTIVWGRFNYDRSVEDSTRFGHFSRNNTTSPYYFYSPAYISYHRSVYTINGLVERPMLGDNLPALLGADYRVGTHFSSNDPRGSLNDFQLNIKSGAGYHFSQRLFVGARYQYGFGQERLAIGYKKTAYYESTVYPDYMNYLENGYGEGTAKLSVSMMKYNTDFTRNYLQLTAKYDANRDHFIFVTNLNKENQHTFYRNSSSYLDYSKYDLTTKDYALYYTHNSTANTLLAMVQYRQTNGKDKNASFEWLNNYRYNANFISGKIALSHRSSSHILWNFVVNGQSAEEERIDGVYGNHVKTPYWRAEASAGFTQNLSKNVWGWSLGPILGGSTNDGVLKISSSSNGLFTQRVIYHDYLYQTANLVGAKISANYNILYSDGLVVGIKAFANYVERNSLKTITATTYELPGKNRLNSGVSLNFYF